VPRQKFGQQRFLLPEITTMVHVKALRAVNMTMALL
jgi:hypothetical protein